jgi:hypothetical protein
MDQAHARTYLNGFNTQRELEVSQECGGGVEASHAVAATRKTHNLRALAAANIQNAPRRYVREMRSELAGDEFLADDLAERA